MNLYRTGRIKIRHEKIIKNEQKNNTKRILVLIKKIDHLNWILFFDYEIQHDRKSSQNNTLEQKMYFKFFCCFYTINLAEQRTSTLEGEGGGDVYMPAGRVACKHLKKMINSRIWNSVRQKLLSILTIKVRFWQISGITISWGGGAPPYICTSGRRNHL